MNKHLIAIILLFSFQTAHAESFALKCTNTNSAIKNSLSITCNADLGDCLLLSRSPNSNRGKNFILNIISAGHGMMTLENAQAGVKVVVNLSSTKSAEIFDEAGTVAICE